MNFGIVRSIGQRYGYNIRRTAHVRHRLLSTPPSVAAPPPIRLSKHLAATAAISRKQAEREIREGNVSIAGKVVQSSAVTIQPDERDLLSWKGKKLVSNTPSTKDSTEQQTPPTLWLVHKLRGELVTAHDPHGRSTVFERLRRYLPKPCIAVGRLDYNTEGLLLLTTDGAYARTLELPQNQYHRVYRVRVHGKVEPHKLTAIRKGTVRDTTSSSGRHHYGPMHVTLETKKKNAQATNQWLQITCTEGKNRQIRNVLQQLGLTVTRLIRISYGDYQLKTVERSQLPAVRVPMLPPDHRRQGRLRTGVVKRPKVDAAATHRPAVQWMRAGQ